MAAQAAEAMDSRALDSAAGAPPSYLAVAMAAVAKARTEGAVATSEGEWPISCDLPTFVAQIECRTLCAFVLERWHASDSARKFAAEPPVHVRVALRIIEYGEEADRDILNDAACDVLCFVAAAFPASLMNGASQ